MASAITTCENPSSAADQDTVVRAVTVIIGAVIGLTFLFGFGNVWALALRLGVFPWVAPLVAPAVDLSVLGLLLAIRRLTLAGASPSIVRPAWRLLVLASFLTLALNVAEPLLTHHYGRAAFDAVGPLLLIGWAEVGPGLLEALNDPARSPAQFSRQDGSGVSDRHADKEQLTDGEIRTKGGLSAAHIGKQPTDVEDLLARARVADQQHWELHRRPISAETLRKELRVGAVRSRELVVTLRSTSSPGAVCTW
ncbi:SpdA protein [Streptodolium elevatio]|uniref:SpdA protein n=1 Tax=Streptodolium elevatio TaxID=3157996 RepID=A0ABV3DWY6_9ACTN